MSPTYSDSLELARSRAGLYPIRVPTTLAVLGRLAGPDPPPGSSSSPPFQPPPIPLLHRPRTRRKLLPEHYTPVVVEVVHALQCRPSSQTYRARVILEDDLLACNVVVKLFQRSLLDARFSEMSYAGDGWECDSVLAQQEAWAYGMLWELQGSTVPYSYGLHVVCIMVIESYELLCGSLIIQCFSSKSHLVKR